MALRLDKTGTLLKLEALEPGLQRNGGVVCHGIRTRLTRALQERSPMLIGLCIARLTKGHSKSESIAEELGDGAQWGLAARDLCEAKYGNELLEHFIVYILLQGLTLNL